ncbi:MAG: prepilin-type N-terminal cleavage/methylation domain-containing protein [bacterium]|jgi:prepilin-type N-terminal cleavage/methylation domain-containing protein|nr:prepilin-type N-terminal cleavage/methylation domain-containing protein [bacterium]
MRPARSAFTLIEILLAMTIMALVVSSIVSTIQVGMKTYKSGLTSLEMYQNARIAIRKMSEEFRFALTTNSFWGPQDEIRFMTMENFMEMSGGMLPGGNLVQEEDPGAIRFMGDAGSILYVRKVYQLQAYPPFDLQECRIFLDQENHLVVHEVLRSLLAVKQATWFYQFMFNVDVRGIILPDVAGGRNRFRALPPDAPLLWDFIGDYGRVGKTSILAEKVTEMQFRYWDGETWKSSWDSQQIKQRNRVSPNSPNYNPSQHMRMEEVGPPAIVEITLTLENGDTLATATDIPTGEYQRSNINSIAPGDLAMQQQQNQNPNQEPKTETPVQLPQ